jgi:hypothetical protein
VTQKTGFKLFYSFVTPSSEECCVRVSTGDATLKNKEELQTIKTDDLVTLHNKGAEIHFKLQIFPLRILDFSLCGK